MTTHLETFESRADLVDFLMADAFFTACLQVVRKVGPPGAFVAAGFIRNRVWDAYYGQGDSYIDNDIDVVYFCASTAEAAVDRDYEKALGAALSAPWQVRNQARMHYFGGHPPFRDLDHALSHWAETATAVGARLADTGQLEWIAPFAFDDLLAHRLRITPSMRRSDPLGFDARLRQKGWLERWPRLSVIRQ